MSGLICDVCGKESKKLWSPADMSRWRCEDCRTPGPLAPLHDLLDEVDKLYEQNAVNALWVVTPTLARVLREVLKENERVDGWDGSMLIGDKLVDRHAIIAFKHGCMAQAKQTLEAFARGLAPPAEGGE